MAAVERGRRLRGGISHRQGHFSTEDVGNLGNMAHFSVMCRLYPFTSVLGEAGTFLVLWHFIKPICDFRYEDTREKHDDLILYVLLK